MRRFALLVTTGLLLASASADTLELTAARSVELALANNKQIVLARARLDEAAYGRNAAFGSFLPQVSATGTYTRLGKVNEFAMGYPIPGKFQFPVYDPVTHELIGLTDSIPIIMGYAYDTLSLGSHDNFALTGTVQQTLFTWGKLVNAYRIAGLNVDMQQAATDQARAQVRVDATQGFYQALLARRTVAVMRDASRQLKAHVDQAQVLYDNGLATRLDLMKATLGLQQLDAQVSQVENGAELALAVLRNVIGVEPGTPVALDEELAPDTMATDLDQALEQALACRPELAQLRDAAQMADLGVRIARTAGLPSFFVQANGSYKNPVGFAAGWGTDWNATAGLSWPLFTGLANYNKFKGAQARYRQARFGLALAEDGIRLEVQAAVSALNQEARNTANQRKNVEVAEAALGLAETRYQNGLLTNLEYLDTQVALTQSRVAYLSALANYQIAKAKLEKAVGEH